MTTRKVVDDDGCTWECKPDRAESVPGRDVNLVCTMKNLKAPLVIKVSWQWMKIAEKGLARMIAEAVAAAAEPVIVK